MIDDDTHRRNESRFAVAAEFVGILTSRGSCDDTLRFMPGGLVHALDTETGLVACGVNAAELEVFWTVFDDDEWLFRCGECQHIVDDLPYRVRDGAKLRQSPRLATWQELKDSH